jgi:hypothetical protein
VTSARVGRGEGDPEGERGAGVLRAGQLRSNSEALVSLYRRVCDGKAATANYCGTEGNFVGSDYLDVDLRALTVYLRLRRMRSGRRLYSTDHGSTQSIRDVPALCFDYCCAARFL